MRMFVRYFGLASIPSGLRRTITEMNRVTHGVTPPALDAKNQKWFLGKSVLLKEKIKLNMPLSEAYGMVVERIISSRKSLRIWGIFP